MNDDVNQRVRNAIATDRAIGDFFAHVLEQLPYEPNDDQVKAIATFAHFLHYGGPQAVYLLNGYAGTGKTSLTGAIVRALTLMNVKVVLLAPTGRAAQVFTEYAGRQAFTIHRRIYRQDSYLSEGFGLAENKLTDAVFIVDEASMIANGGGGEGAIFGTGRLLDDLVQHVYSSPGCRLMLMGDNAQLPPVGQQDSPALNPQVLRGYGLHPYHITLTAIARQAATSGILYNATLLRRAMGQTPLPAPRLELQQFADIEAITGEYLMETLGDCYDRDGMGQTLIVTRSNRRATLFNNGVRNQILFREEELSTGDMLLVAKNNYFWTADYKEIDFIANGDMVQVKRVWGDVERRYGLRFANVTVTFPDRDGLELDAKIILDSLQSDTPALTREQAERLYEQVMAELTGDKRQRYKALKQHPHFNALQVKFAHCVTCHKAQGGQWHNVFIDMGSIPPEATGQLDFYRWFYTALTRARRQVYLINCPLAISGAQQW